MSSCDACAGFTAWPTCAATSSAIAACPVCDSNCDSITSLTLTWTGSTAPTFVGADATASGNSYTLTEPSASSTGKGKSAAAWGARVDVSFGGTTIALNMECTDALRRGHVLNFGQGNTLTLVSFATESGRTHLDCNTCHADDASCDAASLAFCPNPISGIGPVGSNGPLGATAVIFPACVDDCNDCGHLTVDPVTESGGKSSSGSVSSSGSTAAAPVCSAALSIADDGVDDNSCSAPPTQQCSSKGSRARKAVRKVVSSAPWLCWV